MIDPFITVGTQAAKYCNIGAFGVLLFDYAITMESEVNLTWRRRWDIPRIIFVISRYLPFAAAALTTYAAVVIRVSPYCITYNRANNVVHLVSIVASECLLVIRIWALWERSKRILIGLLSLGVILISTEIALSTTITNSQSTLVAASTGECLFEGGTTNAISYGFLVAYEIVLLSLTLVKRHLHFRTAQSPLVKTLYQDSLRYISVILIVSIVNIVITGIPSTYDQSLTTLQVVIHSVLASRIFFNLREQNARSLGESLPAEMTEFRAASRPPEMSTQSQAVVV